MSDKIRISKNKKIFIFLIASILVSLSFSATESFSNNLKIANVSLEGRNPSSNSVTVEFDISWDNSWQTKINHDAVWVTVRLNDPAVVPTDKKLCQMKESGTNPTGTLIDSDSGLEIVIPQDKMGAFIKLDSYGKKNTAEASDVELMIDYGSCGLDDSNSAAVSVMGIEMVFVPEGAFYAGDNDTSTASLDQGSADSDPWYIASESAISVSNPASDGYRYVSAGNSGEGSTGSSFTLPSSYPKGYGSFYVMKYEITEEQWVAFANSLPSSAARANRDITNSSHKNSDSVINRNTISCSGSNVTCSTQRPARAVSYLTWMDLAAFLDWAALRPMTELEYEKMSRGPVLPVEGEYAWGSINITSATALSSGNEDGTEVVTNSGANAQYGTVILTGGDSVNGSGYDQGPLRAGIFATSSSDREGSGAGYYGVLELSGNLSERVVTIGNAAGRNFVETHGDGVLSTVSGYEGNATNADWPGIDALPSRGVTSAEGSGSKGGAWNSASSSLRISDRGDAANASTSATGYAGGRGVRSYDSN